MPATVLVVRDEQSARELAVSALRAAFLEAVGFADPMPLEARPLALEWLPLGLGKQALDPVGGRCAAEAILGGGSKRGVR